MAGNKKISQLVDGGAGIAGDNFVIERGGVNFKVDNSSVSGNPGGLLLDGIVNDMIVKDEKSEIALEQRLSLPPALSFVDSTAVPPTEADTDIYLLDDSGAPNAAWDGAAQNSWVRFDGLAGLWKEIGALDGMICELVDTGAYRFFQSTTSTWVDFTAGAPAGANTEIQFNNAGSFGASSLFTFDTGFGVLSVNAAAVFNDGGTDQDFRIEGLSEPNLFFVDASTDSVGIGGTPSDLFHITSTGSSNAFRLDDTTGFIGIHQAPDPDFLLSLTADNVSASRGIQYLAAAGVPDARPAIRMAKDGDVFFLLNSDGQMGIGEANGSGTEYVVIDLFTANANFGVDTTLAVNIIGGTSATGQSTLNLTNSNGDTNFSFRNNANLHINDSANAQGAGDGVINWKIGTAPGGPSSADSIHMYVDDADGADTAALHILDEQENVVKLYHVDDYTLTATAVLDRVLLASASATTINNNNVLAALITDIRLTGIIGTI